MRRPRTTRPRSAAADLGARGEGGEVLRRRRASRTISRWRSSTTSPRRGAGSRSITPLYRRIIAAYAAGVNRYVARHRDRAAGMDAGDHGGGRPREHAARRRRTRSAGPALVAAAARRSTRAATAAIEPADEQWIDDAGLERVRARGSRTTTGKPILLGNPHSRGRRSTGRRTSACPGTIDFYGSTLRRDSGAARRLQRPSRLRHHQQRARPRRRVCAAGGSGAAGPLPVRRPVDAARRRDVADRGARTRTERCGRETRTFWSIAHRHRRSTATPTRAFAVKSTRLDAFGTSKGSTC